MNITPFSIYTLFLVAIICLSSQFLNAQDGRMMGLVNNQLVQVDPLTGESIFVADTNIPPGVEVTNLAFAPISCLFYGVINSNTNPTLVSISWGGNYFEIGEMLLPSGTVFSCKALAFNEGDNTIYASVSLNEDVGMGINTAESIIGLNSTNGNATFKTTLNFSVETDIDRMVFSNGFLYFNDADLDGANTTNLYRTNFQGVGAMMNATQVLSTPDIGVEDMAAFDGDVFITTTDRGYYKFETSGNNLSYIDDTHLNTEYNGAPIVGLDFGLIEVHYALNIDTVICEGETFSPVISVPGSIVTWSNGQVGSSIDITEPGDYWADIFIFNCLKTSDTIHVEYDECGPCTILYNTLEDNLDLGPDTSICDFHNLEIGVNLGFDVDVEWNTGQTGTTITVGDAGSYEATVYFEDCEWPTTVFTLSEEPCDTCFYVELAVEDKLFIGNDTSICLGDEYLLEIDLDDSYDVVWNNGDIGSSTLVTEPGGTFQASIMTESCAFDSDSIVISSSACERPCEYFIPNAFSPQGDTKNDVFMVYFGTRVCTLVEIELSIFDRWGGFLFKTDKNEWDGKIDGEPIGVGTYTYIAKMIIEQDGVLKSILDSGDVTVLR